MMTERSNGSCSWIETAKSAPAPDSSGLGRCCYGSILFRDDLWSVSLKFQYPHRHRMRGKPMAPRMKRFLAAAVLTLAAGVSISSCSSQSTTSSPSSATTSTTADPTSFAATFHPTYSASPTPELMRRYGGPGVYSVGSVPSGGALAAIPVGRYRVSLDQGETFGTWYRCSSLPCSATSPNQIDSGTASGTGYSTIVDLLPTDGAVYLDGVVFEQVS